jgi:hypothetical protein
LSLIPHYFKLQPFNDVAVAIQFVFVAESVTAFFLRDTLSPAEHLWHVQLGGARAPTLTL